MIPTQASIGRCFAPALLITSMLTGAAAMAQDPAAEIFRAEIEPLLTEYCYDCHGRGVRKGQVSFDRFTSDADILSRTDLWHTALKNVRAGIMPPDDGGPRPSAEEIDKLANWIKYQAFGINPANPDPGLVTVRRLNRVEYRNTIRDLMGIDFNSEVEFPADDSGHGFDNIGDVLSISPLHLEKYLQAAEQITDTAVPKASRVLQRRRALTRDFLRDDGTLERELLTVHEPARVSHTFTVEHTEDYKVQAEVQVRGTFDFDPGRCNLVFTIDGRPMHTEEVIWTESRIIRLDLTDRLTAGDHVMAFEIQPLEPVKIDDPVEEVLANLPAPDAPAAPAINVTPGVNAAPSATPNPAPNAAPNPAANVAAAAAGEPVLIPPSIQRPPVNRANTRLEVRIVSVELSGPASPEFWVLPDNHARFFPKGEAPEDPAAREAYAREVLTAFTTRAFRRPVEDEKIDQLTAIAREIYEQPGRTFEEGFAQAAMVVLASPRFLFRVEPAPNAALTGPSAPLDEFSVASRLSYLLWSTMPDDELFRAAAAGELRDTLAAQTERMLADDRSKAFVRNFTGQWLQVRDVEFLPVNAREILGLTNRRGGGGGPRVDFDGPLRRALRTETEMAFEYIMREDRSLLELIDSDYTFLNGRLATHYNIPDIEGNEFRRVELPEESPLGGVLTHGAVLTVTSNPTRTSPVKRGLFILENILGVPPPPPPPDIPDLEAAREEFGDHEPTLREMLARHREDSLCNSCHSRMDPLGLAFENFNAMGMWRDLDGTQPIDTTGQLVTGEPFADVSELKRILATDRRLDFYRCVTEKLLTYALGRGVEYYDVEAVDRIVAELEAEGGRFSVLLNGVIRSVPFLNQRTPHHPGTAVAASPAPAAL